MITYNQKTVDGESWDRARRVVFENPIDSLRSVKIIEESVIRLNGRDIKEPIGSKEFKLTSEEDYEKTFDLLDPATGALTGETISYGDIYQIIFSLYIKLKKVEDGSIIDEESPSTDEPVEEPVDDPTNSEEV